MNVGPWVTALVMGGIGIVIAFDLWGVSTKWEAANRAWWARRRVQGPLLRYRGSVWILRFLGALLVAASLFVLAALLIDRR